MLIVFIPLAIGILAIPLRYRATSDVMIDPRRERVVDVQQVLADLPADTSAIDTEVEILKSRTLAERVVDRLGLQGDAEFNPKMTSTRRWRDFFSSPSALGGTDIRNLVVARIMARLKVARVGFTYVIAISFTARSPTEAASIANAFTSAYLQQQLDAKFLATHRASDWLNARLGGLRNQVESAEQEVERYKSDHGLMTLSDAEGATINEREISNLDAQLAVARGERAEAEARLSAAETQMAMGGKGDDLGEVLNSPVVQELRKQRAESAQNIAQLEGRYGPLHPELLKAKRQRAEIDDQINQEISRIVSNLKVQVEVGRSRSAAVASALTNAKRALSTSNAASVELKELERNLESVRSLYQSYLDRFKQTSAQDGMAQSDARLVSPARAPLSPAFPNRPLLMGMAFLGAAMTGLLSIWIAEAREDGLYAPNDLERRLGLNCLSMVPLADPTKGRRRHGPDVAPIDQIVEAPFSDFTEAFRAMKAGLFAAKTAVPYRLAVVSALSGEGKSTTCICLGRILARAGTPVVVVDCDLRRRTINRLLAAPVRAGLLDILLGDAQVDDALISDGATGLQFLPIGDQLCAPDDILASKAMTDVLEALSQRFAVVILDMPPLLLVAETRSLLPISNGVLFLARWRKTPVAAAKAAIRILESAGAYLPGAVLTQVDPRDMGRRGYGYPGEYYPFYRSNSSIFARPRRNRRSQT